ncbi:uncharacterized protein LOC133924569 [Phragmites australis]|uniref:uncharacterized protein LOC133924569 n=1 Tax=Phragmites australis TaxID=29695 RepID=UPI002D77A092|nr:uncharacterized protein LOC133924569 [Phragmites australis]
MSLSEKLEAARAALGKRKERELQAQGLVPAPAKAEPTKPAPARGGGDNKILAGVLAHEFLAHGTLLGRRIEPSRTGPASAPAPAARAEPEPKRRYDEVSWLLMASGVHVPGVVNPTQLGRWLQIKD